MNEAILSDNGWNAALHWVIEKGNLDITKKLARLIHLYYKSFLEAMPQNFGFDASDRDSQLALHTAVTCHFLSTVNFLVSNGVDVNNVYNANTALHEAAIVGNIEIAAALFESKLAVNVNVSNGFGDTALCISSKHGHLKMVEFLLKNGADVDAVGQYGYTALHWAARNGYNDITKALIKNNSNVSAISVWKRTPLHIATLNNYFNVIQTLIQNGADLHALDINDMDALDLAVMKNNYDIASLLNLYSVRKTQNV